MQFRYNTNSSCFQFGFDCSNTVAYCYNLQGLLVKTTKINCNQNQINVGDLPSGFYLMVVKDNHKTDKAKFIKIN